MNDADFERLRNRWQEAAVGDVDLDYRRKRRRARWTVFGEVVALIWVLSFATFFLTRDLRPVTVVLCVFVVGFAAVSVAHSWFLRIRLTRELSVATLPFAHTLLAHHELEVRLHRTGRVGIWLTTLFCLAWVPWKLAADWSSYVEHPSAAFIGIGGIIVLFAFIFASDVRTARRLASEGERLDRVLASLR